MDISNRDIRGMRVALQSRFQQGYNVTFGNIPERGPVLETSTDPGSIVYGGQSRPTRTSGVLLQVNKGVVLALGEMRIQDEYFQNPGVYGMLDAAGMVHPVFSYNVAFNSPDSPIKRDPRGLLRLCTNQQTTALVELRGMYETTYEAHDFLPGMLEAMIETWNMRRPLPLLVLPCGYRVERNITEATTMECILESVTQLHKAVKKKGWKALTGPDMVPIGTRTVIRKVGSNTEGEFKWSGRLERDFLAEGYTEEDVFEPKGAADVSLI